MVSGKPVRLHSRPCLPPGARLLRCHRARRLGARVNKPAGERLSIVFCLARYLTTGSPTTSRRIKRQPADGVINRTRYCEEIFKTPCKNKGIPRTDFSPALLEPTLFKRLLFHVAKARMFLVARGKKVKKKKEKRMTRHDFTHARVTGRAIGKVTLAQGACGGKGHCRLGANPILC